MDQSCSDLEFFDFDNASEDEIKEIQAILKGPGSNGCVELPWESQLKENCLEGVSRNEGLTGCSHIESSSYMEKDPKKVQRTVETAKTIRTVTPGLSSTSSDRIIKSVISVMDRSVTTAEENVAIAQLDLKHSQDFLANAQARAEKADKDFRNSYLAASALGGPDHLVFQPVVARTIETMGRSITTANKNVVIAQQVLKGAQDFLANAQNIVEIARNNADMARAGQEKFEQGVQLKYEDVSTSSVEKTEAVASKSDKVLGTVVGQALHFTSPQMPLSPPVARLPPPVETFVAPPTTIGHYANTPYFVSRTLPFVRAYPHMGVPFFACPLPGAGETSPMPTPYGQFVSMVPATVGQEKFVGQVDSQAEPVQKNRAAPSDRQFNRRSKKKLPNTEYPFESENTDACSETIVSEEQQTSVSCPVSTVSSDRPTSLPLVPLPVPQSTFGVAGGTIPLHGYPPGLHTLPYTQMSGPQAPSAAMYYVPVFNHPYGSYIPSPPSAPMVLPVNLRPENESAESTEDCSGEVLKIANAPTLPTSVTKSVEISVDVRSKCEVVTPAPEQCISCPDAKQDLVNITTAKKTLSEVDVMTDCSNLSSDKSPGKSVNSSSPDCIPEKVTIAEDHCKCQSGDEDSKDTGRDASRCWADLFKKPCSEVNGIDRPLATEQEYKNLSNLNKEVSNGKLYTVPASDNIL